MLLFRVIRSRRTKGEKKDPHGFRSSKRHNLPNTHDIGGGANYEFSEVTRPTELQGTPRAEMDWADRIELSAVAER